MELLPLYIFAYGSLMNKKIVDARFPGIEIIGWARLEGYQRSFRKKGRTHLFLTLVPNGASTVKGALLHITTHEQLDALKQSEPGYDLVDVTDRVHGFDAGHEKITVFIDREVATNARDSVSYQGMRVKRSYIEKCRAALDPLDRDIWLSESEFPDGVSIDDSA